MPPARILTPVPQKSRRPLIIYASETGTAEGYARQAGRRLAALSPLVLSMDEVDPGALARESLVLVITSTCRDGAIPGTGQPLADWLSASGVKTLRGVGFAVLGIGNRIYPEFCAAAVRFDAAFENAGAERISALSLADEIAGQADTVKQWLEMFAKRWGADGLAMTARRAIVELIPSARSPEPDPRTRATVAFNDEMLGPDAGARRSTRHIAFNLPDEAPEYAPGDHFAIHPINPDVQVEGICRHLALAPDAWFRVLGAASPSLDRYRDGYPLRRLLAEDLDLTMPDAPEELMAAMHAVSADPDDRLQLERWLETLNHDDGNPARQQLRGWLRETYLTLLDLFDAFPDAIPTLDVLIELLPRMKPRMYSIGSSPRVHPRQVRIMAGALRIPLRDGRVREGMCSRYLAGLEPGDTVRMSVKTAPRRVPSEFDGPVVMVGAGTGIAPLYGMLEDRAARGIFDPSEAPALLYFGCRDEAELLRRKQLVAWREKGLLERLSVAFSRKGPIKAYVQEALDADGARVWSVLRRPDCRFIICGDAKMAQDVDERLLQIVQREGKLAYSEATSFLQAMRSECRYIEDVWGVQLNRDVAMPEMVRSKYDRGASWFARLQRALTGGAPGGGSIVTY